MLPFIFLEAQSADITKHILYFETEKCLLNQIYFNLMLPIKKCHGRSVIKFMHFVINLFATM